MTSVDLQRIAERQALLSRIRELEQRLAVSRQERVRVETAAGHAIAAMRAAETALQKWVRIGRPACLGQVVAAADELREALS